VIRTTATTSTTSCATTPRCCVWTGGGAQAADLSRAAAPPAMLSPRAYQLAGNARVLNIGVRRAGVRRAGDAPADGATLQQRSRGGEETVRTQVAHADPWTTEALYALPEDGMRHELLDGTLLVSPPPSVPHQLAARRLVAALGAAAPPDIEVLEAVGVAVPAGLLVPDVVVARAAAVHGAQRNLAATDVLAVVEIVSPSSRTQDRR